MGSAHTPGVSVKIKLWDPQLVPRTRELAGVETATLAVRVLSVKWLRITCSE